MPLQEPVASFGEPYNLLLASDTEPDTVGAWCSSPAVYAHNLGFGEAFDVWQEQLKTWDDVAVCLETHTDREFARQSAPVADEAQSEALHKMLTQRVRHLRRAKEEERVAQEWGALACVPLTSRALRLYAERFTLACGKFTSFFYSPPGKAPLHDD